MNVGSEAVRDLEDRGMAVLTRMVEAAHREGMLYPDVSAADLALLVRTVGPYLAASPTSWSARLP